MAAERCNLDDNEGVCTADDGEPCAACAASLERDMAHYYRLWRAASPEERDPERYARELREAGR
jgi:hypothetical protein